MSIRYTKAPPDGDVVFQSAGNGFLSMPHEEYSKKRREGKSKRLRFRLLVSISIVAPLVLILSMAISSLILCAQSACR